MAASYFQIICSIVAGPGDAFNGRVTVIHYYIFVEREIAGRGLVYLKHTPGEFELRTVRIQSMTFAAYLKGTLDLQ
jgi:hypothetical protein